MARSSERSERSTRLRVAIVNDYELVVQGLGAMWAPFAERIEVIDLEVGGLPDGPPASRCSTPSPVGDRRCLVSTRWPMTLRSARWCSTPGTFPEEFETDIGERRDAVILKSTSGEQLVDALERIHHGEVFTPSERCLAAWRPTLSEREREVLALLGSGLSNRAIADELYLSVDAVKTHVRNVFAKLDVTNRTRAALIARDHGLTPRGR